MENKPLDVETQKKMNHFMIEWAPVINMHIQKLKNSGMIHQNVDVDDLHMAGLHGLMKAIEKHKGDIGSFKNYANLNIKSHMMQHIRDVGDVPQHLIQQSKNLRKLPESGGESGVG